MSTAAPASFKEIGLSVNGFPLIESSQWELTQGFFRSHVDFRCGECSQMHYRHRSLSRVDAGKHVSIDMPLLSVRCDSCGAYNVFRRNGKTYLVAVAG